MYFSLKILSFQQFPLPLSEFKNLTINWVFQLYVHTNGAWFYFCSLYIALFFSLLNFFSIFALYYLLPVFNYFKKSKGPQRTECEEFEGQWLLKIATKWRVCCSRNCIMKMITEVNFSNLKSYSWHYFLQLRAFLVSQQELYHLRAVLLNLEVWVCLITLGFFSETLSV